MDVEQPEGFGVLPTMAETLPGVFAPLALVDDELPMSRPGVADEL
jgi:hypothetical protein